MQVSSSYDVMHGMRVVKEQTGRSGSHLRSQVKMRVRLMNSK